MSQQHITQEELQITIDFLSYNGPLFSVLPTESETERKKGSSEVEASSSF
ncbi:MAG: hypothetical protein ACXADY_03355 [Candidatus Hodarchaeales archaeon]